MEEGKKEILYTIANISILSLTVIGMFCLYILSI